MRNVWCRYYSQCLKDAASQGKERKRFNCSRCEHRDNTDGQPQSRTQRLEDAMVCLALVLAVFPNAEPSHYL